MAASACLSAWPTLMRALPKGTLLDTHARSETTSVYTGVKVFPMLPAELSEGITSLNENEDRARHGR